MKDLIDLTLEGESIRTLLERGLTSFSGPQPLFPPTHFLLDLLTFWLSIQAPLNVFRQTGTLLLAAVSFLPFWKNTNHNSWSEDNSQIKWSSPPGNPTTAGESLQALPGCEHNRTTSVPGAMRLHISHTEVDLPDCGCKAHRRKISQNLAQIFN